MEGDPVAWGELLTATVGPNATLIVLAAAWFQSQLRKAEKEFADRVRKLEIAVAKLGGGSAPAGLSAAE